MFESLGAFSAVYFALAAVLFLLILFEKKLIAFEERYIKALWDKKSELEKTITGQRITIAYQRGKIKELNCKLKAQRRVNSINLEALRQERLMRAKENNNG